MSLGLWTRIVDALAGATGRAARLDQDDRLRIPGWPRGVDVDALRVRQAASSSAQTCIARTSIDEQAQEALPLFWDIQGRRPIAVARTTRFAVIDGGRNVDAGHASV